MTRPEMLNSRKKRIDVWTILLFAILFVLLVFLIADCVLLTRFYVVEVVGSSMEGTLQNGDLIYASRSRSFSRGDVVIIDVSDNNSYSSDGEYNIIKRVIALEGDALKCENGVVYLSIAGGEFLPLDEPYVKGTNDYSFECVVGEGMIFVMGDNREVSKDSRRTGTFPAENVIGVVPDWVIEHKAMIGGWESFRSLFANRIK